MGTCSLQVQVADDAVHASIMMPNHLPTTLALAEQELQVELSYAIPMCIYDGCILCLLQPHALITHMLTSVLA